MERPSLMARMLVNKPSDFDDSCMRRMQNISDILVLLEDIRGGFDHRLVHDPMPQVDEKLRLKCL